MSAKKTYKPFKSREVKIGNLVIGGDQPIAIQSMTNTGTLDTQATVKQVLRLAEVGCDVVRIAAPTMKAAQNLVHIQRLLSKQGCKLPLIADIHFNPEPAEVAARIVEKVRINPGNYTDRTQGKTAWSAKEIREANERIAERLFPLLKICQEKGTAIRIGTNHGSLSERILALYGNTPTGMVESAMEFVRICAGFGFHNLVLSMKASDVQTMIDANVRLVQQMQKEGFDYPIHLGVTEAGNGEEARIKSAAGIGSLLAMGIGDTVRVSLAEPPENEVPVAKRIVEIYGRKQGVVASVFQTTKIIHLKTDKPIRQLTGEKHPVISNKPREADGLHPSGTDSNTLIDSVGHLYPYTVEKYAHDGKYLGKNIFFKRDYRETSDEELMLKAGAEFAILLRNNPQAGIWISNNDRIKADLSLKILQAMGLRFEMAEFIACPSCGRTQFNLIETFNEVKTRTAHLKGLRIAVMGCSVNGPGEMGNADYGYVGSGPGKVSLYKQGKPVTKNVKEEIAVEALIDLIKENGDWIDAH